MARKRPPRESTIWEWFPFYVGRWLTSRKLRQCSLESSGLLVYLMAMSWDDRTPGIFRYDSEELAFDLRTTEERIDELIRELAKKERILLEEDGSRIRIPYLEQVGREQMEKSAKCSKSAKAGAEKRAREKAEQEEAEERPSDDRAANAEETTSDSPGKRREEKREEEIRREGEREELGEPSPSEDAGKTRRPPIPTSKILNLWNKLVETVPGSTLAAASMTKKRKEKLRVRWSEPVFRERFEEIFRAVHESSFCNGRNDRGWRASFEWVVHSEENYTKVLEGKYADRKKPAKKAVFPLTVRRGRGLETLEFSSEEERSAYAAENGLVADPKRGTDGAYTTMEEEI